MRHVVERCIKAFVLRPKFYFSFMKFSMCTLKQPIVPNEKPNKNDAKNNQTTRKGREQPVKAYKLVLVLGNAICSVPVSRRCKTRQSRVDGLEKR